MKAKKTRNSVPYRDKELKEMIVRLKKRVFVKDECYFNF